MTRDLNDDCSQRNKRPITETEAAKFSQDEDSTIDLSDLPEESQRLVAERLKKFTNSAGDSPGLPPESREGYAHRTSLTSAEQIGFHSTEVQEILGYIPNWIVRWGITLVVAVVALLLVGSWFVKYPDVISAPIVISSTNPPVFLEAKTRGALSYLLVTDSQTVIEGQYLGVIENTADFRQVRTLRDELSAFNYILVNSAKPTSESLDFSRYASLGTLQFDYDALLNSILECRQHIELKPFQNKLASLRTQLTVTRRQYEQYISQQRMLEERLSLMVQQHERTTELYENEMISDADYENARAMLLSEQYSLSGAQLSVTSSELQLSQLEQYLMQTRSDSAQTIDRLWNSIKQASNRLLSQIRLWEQKHVLMASIDGIVSLSGYRNEGQIIKAGDIVMTIVPCIPSDIVGRIELPVLGSGKVRVGQKVNVKFSSYPATEFGMVLGVIQSKSLVPTEEAYIIEVGFPDQLVTNYGVELQFAHQMFGVAEIITADLRLFQRLLNVGRSL